MRKLFRSCFLFAMPRPLFGVARVVDLGARFDRYSYSGSEAEADSRALYMDWLAVADDFVHARAEFRPEVTPETVDLPRTTGTSIGTLARA